MYIKKFMMLLAAAALTLCVLAGCRGGRVLSQVMAGLLEGQYQNVAVETAPDLEAALRAAVREGGELADILARLQQELGLGGGTLTLRGLSGGRQGEHAVELRFEPGSDPDTAARKAFADWDAIFARLPSDGQYAAEIAMVEAEGGYYIAVDVNIVKAGKPDTDDDDEEVGDNYTVNTPNGLVELFEKENGSDFAGKTITLQAGGTYIVSKQLAETFKGTLNGNGATITLTGGSGLFGMIGERIFDEDGAEDHIDKTGTVQNLKIKVTGSISVNDGSAGVVSSDTKNAGAVAGENFGTISNCEVTIESTGSISASSSNANVYAGAVAGENYHSISGCTVSISGSISGSSQKDYGNARAGGVVGDNSGGSISGCTVTIGSTGSISATGNSTAYAGGVAGNNSYDSTIKTCTVTIKTIDSIKATGTGSSKTGDVVGNKHEESTVEDNCIIKPGGEIGQG